MRAFLYMIYWFFLFIFFSCQVFSADYSAQNQINDLIDRVSSVEESLAKQIAPLEEVTYKVDQLYKELNSLKEDLDYRLSQLEQNSVKSQPDKTVGKGKKISERAAYDEATSIMKSGDYDVAKKKFSSFIVNYPKSDLRLEATYWLGEIDYTRKNYPDAAKGFLEAFKYAEKKNKNRAPDILLKLALSLGSAGQKKEACKLLIALPKKYQNASAATKKRAAVSVKKFGCN